MLHYYTRHVSSINMPIFRRTNLILAASGIVALCKRLHSTPVKSGLESALNRCTVQPFTDSSVKYIVLMSKELCIKVGKWYNSMLWCTVKKHLITVCLPSCPKYSHYTVYFGFKRTFLCIYKFLWLKFESRIFVYLVFV